MKIKQTVKCGVCGVECSSLGLSSHLRYKHDGMLVENHISKFGDFRVNVKKANQLKMGKPLHSCLICNDSVKYTATALSFHLKKKHNTRKDDYILTNLLSNIQPTCKCGCGKITKINSYSFPQTTEYVSGHNKSTLGFKFSEDSRKKMSESAIGIRNRHRNLGIKSPRHQRRAVFERVFKTLELFCEKLKVKKIELLSSIDEINQDGIPLKFKCLVTNKEFTQTSLEVMSPYLEKTKSKQQDELVGYLREILPTVEIIENTQKILDGRKEIDIYIPSLKLGIEFDGLYYHSENFGKKDKKYHLWKTENAISKNLKLIHVFEDEWNLKKDIVKEKLKAIVGIRNKVFYARECEIKEIESAQKNQFLNEYHIQGSDKSKTKLGLFCENELVGVMTFSSPNIVKGARKGDDFIELNRYATKYNIVGGASKLLNYFIKKYRPSKIITYADRRWSSKINMYNKIGFKFVSYTPCNYFYLDGSMRRLHRYNFTKYKIIKMGGYPDKSEWENMKIMGYDRIWDCGHLKYEMNIP